MRNHGLEGLPYLSYLRCFLKLVIEKKPNNMIRIAKNYSDNILIINSDNNIES